MLQCGPMAPRGAERPAGQGAARSQKSGCPRASGVGGGLGRRPRSVGQPVLSQGRRESSQSILTPSCGGSRESVGTMQPGAAPPVLDGPRLSPG